MGAPVGCGAVFEFGYSERDRRIGCEATAVDGYGFSGVVVGFVGPHLRCWWLGVDDGCESDAKRHEKS